MILLTNNQIESESLNKSLNQYNKNPFYNGKINEYNLDIINDLEKENTNDSSSNLTITTNSEEEIDSFIENSPNSVLDKLALDNYYLLEQNKELNLELSEFRMTINNLKHLIQKKDVEFNNLIKMKNINLDNFYKFNNSQHKEKKVIKKVENLNVDQIINNKPTPQAPLSSKVRNSNSFENLKKLNNLSFSNPDLSIKKESKKNFKKSNSLLKVLKKRLSWG